MDFHDEVMIDWRENVLGEIESFCHSNILELTPPKFRYWRWYLILGIGTIIVLFASFLLAEQYNWLSNMLGNVAAGLIASFVLLLFTNAKEKNLSYYDYMTPKLRSVVNCLQFAFNKLYWEQRELRQSKGACFNNADFTILENYRIFGMKVFLTHKMLLDLYRQISATDKLQYSPLACSVSILNVHERDVENFLNKIETDYSSNTVGNFDEYDNDYLSLWEREMELMRNLSSYVSIMQENIYFVRFGCKRKSK